MIKLDKITIICLDCCNYGKAIHALQKSNKQVAAYKTILLTDIFLEIDGIEVIKINKINSKEEYSNFIIKELYKYFDTEYCLVVQHDGYIINGESWDEEFLEYDYIGAPWLYIDGKNVGNGGASLRSKKLQYILGIDEFIKSSDPEDQCIGRLYRDYLIKEYNIKFPTEELADTFSYELREPKCKTFMFHGFFHEPFKPTIILKRTAALGDCILLEPVMRFFYEKGNNIVLDIPISWYALFSAHYFPVKHISQFDKERISAREINLDMAYETKPKQNYLKSYFEYCGVKDYYLSKPILYPFVNNNTKIFKKYCVVHIDDRETTHRNIFGVNFLKVRKYLESCGFVVLQVGNNKQKTCGIDVNTTNNLGMLKFLIAGCDLFIGVDSAPSHIAMAYNKPCVLFFGSVDPDKIHVDLTNVEIIQQGCIYQGCWHEVGGTSGKECVFNEKMPPCCVADTDQVLESIFRLIK